MINIIINQILKRTTTIVAEFIGGHPLDSRQGRVYVLNISVKKHLGEPCLMVDLSGKEFHYINYSTFLRDWRAI